MQAIFGDQAPHWVVRLPFVIEFTGTLICIFALGRLLFSAEAGLWAVIFLSVSPFFFASAGSWIVPDGPLDLFLALSALLLARILYADLTPNARSLHWLALGVTFGLATLSKYHAFLFAAGALTFLMATRHRRQLAAPSPWIAGLIALALFSPVILWNAEHGWISLAFQSGRSNVGGGLYPLHVLQSLAGQSAYLLPWTLIILGFAQIRALAARPAWLGAAMAHERAWFLASLALPPILIFTILPLFGSRGLPHWPMPGWLFAFPIAGAMLAMVIRNKAGWPIWLAGGSAGLIAVLMLAVCGILDSATIDHLAMSQPELLGETGVLTPLVTEAADWRGLSAGLEAAGLQPSPTRFVVALRWFEAARISAELGRGAEVAVFNPDARGFAFLVDQQTLVGQDAVVITEPNFAGDIARDVAPYFKSIDPPKTITIMVAGGLEKSLTVTLAHDLRAPFPLAYGQATTRR